MRLSTSKNNLSQDRKSGKAENRRNLMPSTLQEAVYKTIHESNVPPKQISKHLNISYQQLLNTANPNLPFKFSIRHAPGLIEITDNPLVLNFLCYKSGFHLFRVPNKNQQSEGAIELALNLDKTVQKLTENLNFLFRSGGDNDLLKEIDESLWILINTAAALRSELAKKRR